MKGYNKYNLHKDSEGEINIFVKKKKQPMGFVIVGILLIIAFFVLLTVEKYQAGHFQF